MALLCWGVMAVAVIVGARRSAEVVVVIVVATAGSPVGIAILVPIITVAAVLDVS